MAAVDIHAAIGGNALLRGKSLGDLAWVFGAKFISILSGLAVYALLARLLSVGEMGRYILFVSLTAFFGLAVQFGIGTSTLKALASDRAIGNNARAGNIAWSAIVTVFVIGSGFGLVWMAGFGNIVLTLFGMPATNRIVIAALAVWILLVAFQRLFADIFRGLHQVRIGGLFDGAAMAVVFVLALVIILFFDIDFGLEKTVFLAIFSLFTVVLFAFFMVWRSARMFGSFHICLGPTMLALCLPVLVTELSVFISNQADIWIVAILLPAQDVAIYGVATRLVFVLLVPTVILTSVIVPKIVRFHAQKNFVALQELLTSAALLAFLPSLVILVVIILLGDKILVGLFGPQYTESYGVLIILAFGRITNIATGFCSPCLLFCGGQKAMMVSTVFFILAAITGAFILAPRYGIFGVAVCFSIMMALQNIVQAILVKKFLGVSTTVNLGALGGLFVGPIMMGRKK